MIWGIAGVWILLLASEAMAPALGATVASFMQSAGFLAATLLGIVAWLCPLQQARSIAWRHGPVLTPRRVFAGLMFILLLGVHGRHGLATLWDSVIWVMSLAVWGSACTMLPTPARARLLTLLTVVPGLCAGVYLLAADTVAAPAYSALMPASAWPLMNPNHSGALFASALVLVAGVLNHRFVIVWQSAGLSPWRRIVRTGGVWFDLGLVVLLTAAIVRLGSFSALAVAVGGTVLLILGDHYARLDWVMRRAMDAMGTHQRWILAAGLVLPLVLVILTGGVTDLYRGSVVRLSIWSDSVRLLLQEPMAWLWGLGPLAFSDAYARVLSWHSAYPTHVLGPESELLYGLLTLGLGGVLALAVVLEGLPWTRIFSKRMGVLSHYWQARLALWALVVVLAQAMVDNTLHTIPMLYWAVMLASLSLRTIKANTNP